jgi:threonine dehydratase
MMNAPATVRADRTLTYDDVIAAHELVKGAILHTPTLQAPLLSKLTGAIIYVKYENLQVTNAFKERGALVKLLRLNPDERQAGVVAMSAGNHAQALAYHANRLGIPATIVMPETTPYVKVLATRAHGANVVLQGETLHEAQECAEDLGRRHGLVWVHPFNDFDVMAGQGTVALEMLNDAPDIDTFVVPVGGGGLIAGMAAAAKGIKPDVKIIGVESALYPAAQNALKNEHQPIGGATLAEGIAVKTIGSHTLPFMRDLVEDIILVSEEQLERAVNVFATTQKSMAEGAGAAGLAAVMAHPERFAGRHVGLVLSGGNIDPRLLAAIMVRELERNDRVAAFRLTIKDQPGILGRIATRLGDMGANILEVSHRRLYLDVPAKGASLDVTVETRDHDHANEILAALREEGLNCRRIASAESGAAT